MQPQALFMMMVQTLVLRNHGESSLALIEAAQIPEEAYANVIAGVAAVQWWEWRRTRNHKPDWLEAYEEARRNLVVIRRKRWPFQQQNVTQWAVALSDAKSQRALAFSPSIHLVVEDARRWETLPDGSGSKSNAPEARVTRAEGEQFFLWAMATCRVLGVECPFEFEADPPLQGQP